VPFDSLRSINPHTDGRLDLDKVRAIVFVIDKGAMKPGSRGTIWIDDVGVY
jgi:HD superfamily phosphohydrolase YqeK